MERWEIPRDIVLGKGWGVFKDVGQKRLQVTKGINKVFSWGVREKAHRGRKGGRGKKSVIEGTIRGRKLKMQQGNTVLRGVIIKKAGRRLGRGGGGEKMEKNPVEIGGLT